MTASSTNVPQSQPSFSTDGVVLGNGHIFNINSIGIDTFSLDNNFFLFMK